MATKYKEYFQLMLENNKELFDEFRRVHDKFVLDPSAMQEEFNEVGGRVRRVIHEWEDKLCNRSQKTGYGQYAGKLAEKFQEEIRKEFPKIDSVGIKTFKIDRISLEKN